MGTLGTWWLDELSRLLPVRSGFVLAGRPADLMVVDEPTTNGVSPVKGRIQSLNTALKERLHALGIEMLLTYDISCGLDVEELMASPRGRDGLRSSMGISGAIPARIVPNVFFERLLELEEAQLKLQPNERARYGALVSYASRILEDRESSQSLSRLQRRCDITVARMMGMPESARHCPVVLWVESVTEAPAWLLAGSQRIDALTVPAAMLDERRNLLGLLASRVKLLEGLSEEKRESFLDELAVGTANMSLADIDDMTRVVGQQSAGGASELVRTYQLGDRSQLSPWRSSLLADRIRHAETNIDSVVLGQAPAIAKAVDLLMRSMAGLSGAHMASSPNRPRGVLFLAGPTGTGKTELAKQIAKVVFGSTEAVLRFDMSEYATEHNEARLIGSPPGYVGSAQGGQLTESVRANPFSLLLFDEIEKAHPRILDKFLQILEDGRLTDGRGQTAYFSDCIIVFTSNLGMKLRHENTQGAQPHMEMEYADLAKAVLQGVQFEFTDVIRRPELLNRLGDNIVVFNYVNREIGARIAQAGIDRVLRRIAIEHQLQLVVAPDAQGRIVDECLTKLEMGGRGVLQRLESIFLTPLSRAILTGELAGRNNATVADIVWVPDKQHFVLKFETI